MGGSVPTTIARLSSTPWYIGVATATAWSQPGSWVTGKNAPEGRQDVSHLAM